jgi:ABC-type glycerol-3-phosphate transport system substrate-binding protein
MRQVALVVVLGALMVLAAGCGGGGGGGETEAENQQAKAACEGSPLSEKPNLPPGFPMVENTTLTTQSTQGPTEVVEGYWEGDLEEAHDEYVKEFEAAGYKVLFEEVEEHDSEVSWEGEGRTGQVALRDDCGGDKIYVHITNRPE